MILYDRPAPATNFPQLLAFEVWENTASRSTSYVHLDGTLPTMTDHLTTTTIEVIGGSGEILVPGTTVGVQAGSVVTVNPGTPRLYRGSMSWVAIHEPGIVPALVTYGDEKLGRHERRALRLYRTMCALHERKARMIELIDGPLQYLLELERYKV